MVAANTLRVVFFGTPDFAVPTLDQLLNSHHRVVCVVTQPDRPRGRGRHWTDAPVKATAIEACVPLLQPERLKDPAFLRALSGLSADLGVVAAYGNILPDEVLAIPRLGLINVHASILPRYRGAAPVHRAVIAGERETGVTIMRVVKALDAGPVLAGGRRAIDPNDTSEDVERQLAQLGADLLLSTADGMAAGLVTETPQDERAVTYAPRLTKQEGLVDWSMTAERVHNLIRGLHPWPLAFSFVNGHRLILRRSAVVQEADWAEPGTVVVAAGDRLVISTGRGGISVLEIQPEGKRSMTTREFLAGHQLTPGDRLGSHP